MLLKDKMIRLTDEQLQKLSTGRLLTYFKKYRNRSWDGDDCGVAPDKETQNELDYIQHIREILSGREHVER